uniref:Keratinocyte associated protein 3 n=1 Tax=Callorhinchus milii TaxID=7868 RepID=A0A4W3J2Y7_CALMI
GRRCPLWRGYEGERTLMKTGITLIVIGHLNFILGSIVHGTVLRHVTVPGDGILVEYSVTTIMSVISGIVSISTGIIVIVLSRDLSNTRLQYVVFASSMSNCLISLACMLGLAVSVIITIINGGRTLLAVCGLGSTKDILQVTNECPFDPTRIYDTALAMWIPSLILSGVEVFLSIRCFLVALNLLGSVKRRRKNVRKLALSVSPNVHLHEERRILSSWQETF